jgi:hypothetical protein
VTGLLLRKAQAVRAGAQGDMRQHGRRPCRHSLGAGTERRDQGVRSKKKPRRTTGLKVDRGARGFCSLAVGTLMTSSKLVDRTTGKSAGLAPLRIRTV